MIEKRKVHRHIGRWLIPGLVLLLTVTLIGYWYMKERPSNERIEYFNGSNPIIFHGKQEGNAYIDGDQVYLPIDWFHQHLEGLLHVDKDSQSVILTTKTKVIKIPIGKKIYYDDLEKIDSSHTHILSKKETLYISLQTIETFYPLQFKVLPKSSAVQIYINDQEIQWGKVEGTEDEDFLRLRTSPSLKSPYVAKINSGDTVSIEEEKEDFYFVRMEDGRAGYIQKRWIEKTKKEKIVLLNPQSPYSIKEVPNPIQLVWEAVYTKTPDPNELPQMPGINVVSPTWFHLEDGNGNVKSLASSTYVKWAKDSNRQVWALFSNNFDPDLTHEALRTFEKRKKIIQQLVKYAKEYELDGFNIDIENVYLEDGPLVTQFMRELTPALHRLGLIVSMDITFISDSENWSMFYEREKLTNIVDYLIVMAYDEHTSLSSKAGSVSSLPWVENNLISLLKIIPNDRLILGIPFYTRLWKETINDHGEIQLSSIALTMNEAEQWVKDHDLTPVFDEETEQYYVEYENIEENTLYKMWLEDRSSLMKRIQLAQNYELAGIAGWSRYFGNDMAWASFGEMYATNQNEE